MPVPVRSRMGQNRPFRDDGRGIIQPDSLHIAGGKAACSCGFSIGLRPKLHSNTSIDGAARVARDLVAPGPPAGPVGQIGAAQRRIVLLVEQVLNANVETNLPQLVAAAQIDQRIAGRLQFVAGLRDVALASTSCTSAALLQFPSLCSRVSFALSGIMW